KQIIDLKRNLFKIDVRAQKDEEKVFMRTAWDTTVLTVQNKWFSCIILRYGFFITKEESP
ncbi:hypothetical protein WA66_06985, partial [Streptococcus agalactiae]